MKSVRYWIDTSLSQLLDRLTHHCHVVQTGNESYRFQHSSSAAKLPIKAREQTRKQARRQPPTNRSYELAHGKIHLGMR